MPGPYVIPRTFDEAEKYQELYRVSISSRSVVKIGERKLLAHDLRYSFSEIQNWTIQKSGAFSVLEHEDVMRH